MIARRHAPSPVPFVFATTFLALASSSFALGSSVLARPLDHSEPASRRVTTSASALANTSASALANTSASALANTSAPALAGDLDKVTLRSLRDLAAQSLASPIAVGPRASSAARVASGPFPLACQSVDLVLDGFGALGSSTAGGDARFRAGGASFGTIFESMAFARGAGFLEGLSLALPQSASGAHPDGAGVSARFVAGPWRFELHSGLENCAPEQATLRQEWTITNVASGPEYLAFTAYLDGDLFARGSEDDDFGARVASELILFDEGADRDQATAFIGLSSEAPEALRIHREVGEFSEQRRRVARGAFVSDRLVRADGSRADVDGDGVTDRGFDASLAIGHDFGTLAPGESRRIVSRIRWGVGSIREITEHALVISAGADRILECEGREGSVVRVDASASPDASRIVEWAWGIDGVIVAREVAADLLLLPGRHVVSLEGIDSQGRIALDEAIIEILDTIPPTLEVAAVITLWPPNHRLVPVRLPIDADDACSGVASVVPVAVVSDEADDARGAGTTDADAQLAADGTLLLRAERSGQGDGRVYRVLVEARDAAGNLALAEVRVEVPHDARGGATDSGAATETVL